MRRPRKTPNHTDTTNVKERHGTHRAAEHRLETGPYHRRTRHRTNRRVHVRTGAQRQLADWPASAVAARARRMVRREPVHRHRGHQRAVRLWHRRRAAWSGHANRQQHVVADAAGRARLGRLRGFRLLQSQQRHHPSHQPVRVHAEHDAHRHRRARPAALSESHVAAGARRGGGRDRNARLPAARRPARTARGHRGAHARHRRRLHGKPGAGHIRRVAGAADDFGEPAAGRHHRIRGIAELHQVAAGVPVGRHASGRRADGRRRPQRAGIARPAGGRGA